MKKSLFILVSFLVSFSVSASISEKFAEGYELRSLELNTEATESSLSLFLHQQMLYLSDGKVFISSIDTAQTNLLNPVENKELTQMGIHGTVATDTISQTIYFSLVESKECEWLYASTYENGKWSQPERLIIEGMQDGRESGNFLANAGWRYYHKVKQILQNPSLSNNGKRLYFTSATIANGQGGKDLWCMDKQSNGHWSTPINLGPTINTEADEDYAFVEDNEKLYFSSNQGGMYHLYQALPADGWKVVEPMETPYKSALADRSIVVTQETPFLVSDRNLLQGSDIYAFYKLPCEIKISDWKLVPDSVGKYYNLQGEVVFANAPRGSQLNFTWADSSYVASASLGSPYVFNFADLDRPAEAIQDSLVVALNEDCRASVDFEAPAMSYIEKKRQFYWVFFLYDFDKDILATNFQQELDSLASEMKKFPDAIFEVAGYTDSRGSETYNDRLSQRRAQDIVNLLQDAGIPQENMKAVGYGERCLQVPNAQTEEEHAQNRRVEVRILNVDESPAVVESSHAANPETINPENK